MDEKLIERVMKTLDNETFDAIHADHLREAAVAVIAEVRKFDRKKAKA